MKRPPDRLGGFLISTVRLILGHWIRPGLDNLGQVD
jgi:hypothetical protein